MTLHILDDLEQGSEEWHAQRRGIVTASVVGRLLSTGAPDAATVACPTCSVATGPCLSIARKVPTLLKTVHTARSDAASDMPAVVGVASNDTSRALTMQLAAERITGWTDPTYVNDDDMLRGVEDEPRAVDVYSEHFAPVETVGFMVRVFGGSFRIGYSPDGLVGDAGLIEIKSRRPKKQLQTILADEVPAENMAQLQCGLLVSGREWIDYVSFCGGMPLYRKRIEPDHQWQTAILEAVQKFEDAAAQMVADYRRAVEGLPMTERTLEEEMVI